MFLDLEIGNSEIDGHRGLWPFWPDLLRAFWNRRKTAIGSLDPGGRIPPKSDLKQFSWVQKKILENLLTLSRDPAQFASSTFEPHRTDHRVGVDAKI